MIQNLATQEQINDLNTNKANSSHTHDDRYYTEIEIDTKLAMNSIPSALGSTVGGAINLLNNNINKFLPFISNGNFKLHHMTFRVSANNILIWNWYSSADESKAYYQLSFDFSNSRMLLTYISSSGAVETKTWYQNVNDIMTEVSVYKWATNYFNYDNIKAYANSKKVEIQGYIDVVTSMSAGSGYNIFGFPSLSDFPNSATFVGITDRGIQFLVYPYGGDQRYFRITSHQDIVAGARLYFSHVIFR